MKTLLIRILLGASGYAVPVQELQDRLSVIAPTRIEVLDTANSPHVNSFYGYHYALVFMREKNDPLVILHAPYLDDSGNRYSGGKASATSGVATVSIVPGFDERNMQVILHEILHLGNVSHNDLPCNVMNPQPCGLTILPQDVQKARRGFRRQARWR